MIPVWESALKPEVAEWNPPYREPPPPEPVDFAHPWFNFLDTVRPARRNKPVFGELVP